MKKADSAQSHGRDGFLFLANDLALDFVNTRLLVDDVPQELLADWQSLLRWFQAAGLIKPREAANLEQRWAKAREVQKTLEAMLGLRERLRRELLQRESGAPVRAAILHELNELMSNHPMLTKIESQQGKLARTQWFPVRQSNDLFAPLAHAAAKLLSDTDPKRVRKCEHCILHFHDTSKIGTRRWCSMRLCGNRAKVAAYAARHS